jgi:C_GCAxxG_C_C family probable redox protein
MPTKAAMAADLFTGGLLCSQAILMTYGPDYGLDEDTALRLARPFGSGMARMCATCGAVSGAYMVLGLKYDDENEKTAKETVYAQSREFARRFREKHGSTNCYELLGCDFATPEGQARFREEKLIVNCAAYVKDAAAILEDMLK